jgi:hypothetical protein
MKYQICVFATVCALVAPALALQPKNLVGTWKGSHKETKNGRGTIFKGTITGAKNSAGDIQLKEKITDYSLTAKYTFRKDGKFASEAVLGGFQILSSYRGTWKLKDGKIVITASGTDGKLYGSVKSTSSGFQFVGETRNLSVVVSGRK